MVAPLRGADPPVATTNPATRPASRGGWWMQRHNAIVERVKQGKVDLILLGDSITNNYDKRNPPHEDFAPTWDAFYGSRNAVNMGFSGDHTGNLLWRLEHGEIDGITPKVALVLIGTNNTAGARHTAEQTVAGIEAVVAKLRQKLPGTKVLLLAILPSEQSGPPGKPAVDQAVNQALAERFSGSDFVTFVDIGSVLLREGRVNWDLYYDPNLPPPTTGGKPRGPLHPNTRGQRLMAETIEPTLSRLMGDQSKVK